MEDIHVLQTNLKQTSLQISALSERIMYKNRDTALLLSKMLKKQIGELQNIRAYDCTMMLENAETALSQGSVSEIGERVMQNGLWLERYQKFTDNVAKYRNVVDGCLMIQHVNDMMAQHIEKLCYAIRFRCLAEITADMEKAEVDYNHIFTDEALLELTNVLHGFEERANNLPSDDVRSALIESISEQKTLAAIVTRIEMLRALKHLEAEMLQHEIRQQISQEMERYQLIREEMVGEYEGRGLKRTDVKLEDDISKHTQTITSRIDDLILQLYKHLAFTDKEVVEDILKFTNYTNQQARVLALLIANPKVKRLLLPGMLNMYGNLNPVISRLVNNKIKPNEVWLQSYVDKHPASIVAYILRLVD